MKKTEILILKDKEAVYMDKFLKALKNYYIVFSLCVVCVGIAGTIFGIRFYREQKARITALTPPPVVVAGNDANVEKKEIEPVKEPEIKHIDKKESVFNNESVFEKAEETMSVPIKENFKISMPVGGKLLNEFSGDVLVYSKTFDDYRVHKGIDIEAKRSEAVLAVADGVVENVYTDYMQGIVIEINHKNGYKSIYKNLSTDKMVKKGETVVKGQVISGVGETAVFEAMEPGHIHLELIKDEEFVDPTKFFE